MPYLVFGVVCLALSRVGERFFSDQFQIIYDIVAVVGGSVISYVLILQTIKQRQNVGEHKKEDDHAECETK